MYLNLLNSMSFNTDENEQWTWKVTYSIYLFAASTSHLRHLTFDHLLLTTPYKQRREHSVTCESKSAKKCFTTKNKFSPNRQQYVKSFKLFAYAFCAQGNIYHIYMVFSSNCVTIA